MAACGNRPWRAALAGSMLLDRLDATGARAAFVVALAGRAPVRCPHGGARSPHGNGGAAAGRSSAYRRVPLGPTTGLAQAIWWGRAERVNRESLAPASPCPGSHRGPCDRAVDL